MLFKDYKKIIESTEEVKEVKSGSLGWVYSTRLMRRASVNVKSINSYGAEVIKLPRRALNMWGDERNVSRFMVDVFQLNDNVTDIILHSRICGFPEGAFRGCKNLRRITIPKGVRRIGKDVFAGCDSLEDVYYEGTIEEWEKVEIYTGKRVVELGELIPGTPVYELAGDCFKHDPGNDALFKANVHFQCVWDVEKHM